MNRISKYLSEEDLTAIEDKIAEVERKTSGEIRVSVRAKRNLLEKLYKPHELAVREFERLGMADTKQKTGILLFIIFEEHFYDILADEGIYQKIPEEVWSGLEEKLKEEFRNGNYLRGIIHSIERMGWILEKEFPAKPGDVDELKDEVAVG
jgi:uncharacterized membrane protein